MSTSGDEFEMNWDFLSSGMIIEEEEIPRLVINVLESNNQELKTETLFDEVQVYKSHVVANDDNLTRFLTTGEQLLNFEYQIKDGELRVTVYDPEDYEPFSDYYCLFEEGFCFGKELEFGPVSLDYKLDSSNGMIKEVVSFTELGITMFTEIDFFARELLWREKSIHFESDSFV